MGYFLAKVKGGERVRVDRHFEISGDDFDRDKIFLCKKTKRWCELVSTGYGAKDSYVNGSAYTSIDRLERLTPTCLIDSPILDGHRYR